MIIGKEKKFQKSKKSPTQSKHESARKKMLLLLKAIDFEEFSELQDKMLPKLMGEAKRREKTEN